MKDFDQTEATGIATVGPVERENMIAMSVNQYSNFACSEIVDDEPLVHLQAPQNKDLEAPLSISVENEDPDGAENVCNFDQETYDALFEAGYTS